jgi:hypothetical protein
MEPNSYLDIFMAEGFDQLKTPNVEVIDDPVGELFQRAALNVAVHHNSNTTITKASSPEWDLPIAAGERLAKRAPAAIAARIEKRVSGWILEYNDRGELVRGHLEAA